MTRPSKPTERERNINIGYRAQGHHCNECRYFPAGAQQALCPVKMALRESASGACSEGRKR